MTRASGKTEAVVAHVRWLGFPPEADTWDIRGQLLRDVPAYDASLRQKSGARAIASVNVMRSEHDHPETLTAIAAPLGGCAQLLRRMCGVLIIVRHELIHEPVRFSSLLDNRRRTFAVVR